MRSSLMELMMRSSLMELMMRSSLMELVDLSRPRAGAVPGHTPAMGTRRLTRGGTHIKGPADTAADMAGCHGARIELELAPRDAGVSRPDASRPGMPRAFLAPCA